MIAPPLRRAALRGGGGGGQPPAPPEVFVKTVKSRVFAGLFFALAKDCPIFGASAPVTFAILCAQPPDRDPANRRLNIDPQSHRALRADAPGFAALGPN